MLAFTFPGQGSQRPGMGAAWREHPSWELVDYASEIVGRDVAALLLDADQETLTRTANAQLVIFVQSLVVLDAAERVGLEPAACAGHSLGEYTALVAAGALSYEDGVRLVAERGGAMQDAAEQAAGTMVVVLGLDDDDVAAACARAQGDAWVANFNAPGQVVIAGAPDALERAGAIATELGARRVMSIPVGGAFHTPLMAPARDRLRKVLGEVTFHEPDPVVIANVDSRPHLDPTEWLELLSAQICSPVRWRQTLQTLRADGIVTFVELGPGGVLTGLVKRTIDDEAVSAHSVVTPEDLEALVQLLAGPAVRTPVEESPADRFQMTERLIVSSGTGKFRPTDGVATAQPRLSEARDGEWSEPILIEVGQLVGWAGETEIRSSFAGTLEGVIVLADERVVTGQPVAWLRTRIDEGRS